METDRKSLVGEGHADGFYGSVRVAQHDLQNIVGLWSRIKTLELSLITITKSERRPFTYGSYNTGAFEFWREELSSEHYKKHPLE